MRVGILYDLFDDYPWLPDEPADADAENEPPETVEAISSALRSIGHSPILLGSPWDLLDQRDSIDVDVAVNISEAAHSRNREGFGPTLMEMLNIPFIGSDAVSLSVSLDKATTKDLALAAGLATPPFSVIRSGSVCGKEDLPAPFPLFVKPRYEGSSKGITVTSKVQNEVELHEEVRRTHLSYQQDALVEAFVDGAEYTVAVLGAESSDALPVMQRAVERETGIGLHALERRGLPPTTYAYDLPGILSDDLEQQLQHDAQVIFRKLECRDFARIDFRVDSRGKVWFLEINPLPTFAPDGTFAILAEMMDEQYESFLGDILDRAITRVMQNRT
jgi:D-alanine-D-alanine ligase